MHFIKSQGLGNDFIIIEGGLQGADSMSPEHARDLCRRGSGIGADGVMLARPSDVADVRMELTNSDGSIPEMCGNGLRCFVKHAVDDLGLEQNPLRVETNGGVKACGWTRAHRRGPVVRVRVDMGPPSFDRATIPMSGQGPAELVDVQVEGRSFSATGVNTGNPHMVIFGDADRDLARTWGPLLTCHPMWPLGANVEFAALSGPRSIEVSVWERGCGLTLACGTGATAVAAAAVRLGWMPFGDPITVRLPGGELDITIETDFETAWMDGPVVEVYRGRLTT